ncbi:MAG: hypothetical protein AABY15_06795 [Nanoarchaeota archaeon]
MYKFVSDIEDLSVEWDGCYGKHWQTFASAEEMNEALRKNEEFNNLPENKKAIDELLSQENVWLAKCTLEYDFGFEHFIEKNIRMEVAPIIRYVKRYGEVAVAVITKMVTDHNKRVMKTQVVPKPATNCIGDFAIFTK